MKSKKVFVVHGRNEPIKNQIFNFLRSIKLEPIDWPIAVSLTGKGAPFIFDVVRAGIEASQCCLVLFTGDDTVKLRSEFGLEKSAYQPRPNVIFEAGIALSLIGQDQTIIVTFEDLRQLSDLGGMSFLKLDNNPESRKSLINRLKTAGCDLDDSGTDYLNHEKTGNFDALSLSEPEESNDSILQRGGFTDYIVDSSISHSISSLDLNKELYDYLKNGNRMDLKFNYLGNFCASNWLDLTDDPSYGHEGLKTMIKDNISDVISQCAFTRDTEVDLISLGPGDGKIDLHIIRELQRTSKFLTYYPLDLSFELLQKSTAEVLKTAFIPKTFKIKAIHGDFTQLIKYQPIYGFDSSINLFSLLGYTFGNFNEGQLIGKLREGMQKGDFLLIDARLHNFGDVGRKISSEEKEKIKSFYQQSNRFSFGPVESATLANFRDAKFDYDVSTYYTVVDNAINLTTYCVNLNTKFRYDFRTLKREKLNLSVTTMYSFEDLAEWFLWKGFNLLVKKKVKDTGFYLLMKNND